MTINESHGFVLWGVPRFHRQSSESKPPAPERKQPIAAEPSTPPTLQNQDKPEPVTTRAA